MKLIFFVVFLELVLKYLIEVLHAGKIHVGGIMALAGDNK
jgi:K+ transporter